MVCKGKQVNHTLLLLRLLAARRLLSNILYMQFLLQDGWCQFDLFVAAISIFGVAVDMGTTQNLEFLPLVRVLRVARIFRLIPKAQGLRYVAQQHMKRMRLVSSL